MIAPTPKAIPLNERMLLMLKNSVFRFDLKYRRAT
jgi:hypothetical protein